MKAKKAINLVFGFWLSTAPRARRPSAKHVLDREICNSYFSVFQFCCKFGVSSMPLYVSKVRHLRATRINELVRKEIKLMVIKNE